MSDACDKADKMPKAQWFNVTGGAFVQECELVDDNGSVVSSITGVAQTNTGSNNNTNTGSSSGSNQSTATGNSDTNSGAAGIIGGAIAGVAVVALVVAFVVIRRQRSEDEEEEVESAKGTASLDIDNKA